MLPVHGTRYQPDDWMALLLALHGDKIYAYDAYFGDDFYIFPVYFEGTGQIAASGTARRLTRPD